MPRSWTFVQARGAHHNLVVQASSPATGPKISDYWAVSPRSPGGASIRHSGLDNFLRTSLKAAESEYDFALLHPLLTNHDGGLTETALPILGSLLYLNNRLITCPP